VMTWAGRAAGGRIGSGAGAVSLERFAVSCCTSGCRFEDGSARSGAGAGAIFDVVGDAVGDVVSGVVAGVGSGVVGDVGSDPVSNVVSKDAVVVIRDVGGESVVPGTVAELAADLTPGLASGLTAGFEFRLSELRLGLELAPRFGAGLGLDLESTFVSGLETDPSPLFSSSIVPNFVANFAPDWESAFALVSAATD